MFKLFATASIPLILAIAKVYGFDLEEEQAIQLANALDLVIGAVGTLVALAVPSLRAKLKFGEEAE